MATIFGDIHDNWLKGTNHSDLIRGNVGSDTIVGRGGNDVLFGDEMDTAQIANDPAHVSVVDQAWALAEKADVALDAEPLDVSDKEAAYLKKLEMAKLENAKHEDAKLLALKYQEMMLTEDQRDAALKLQEQKVSVVAEVATAVEENAAEPIKHAINPIELKPVGGELDYIDPEQNQPTYNDYISGNAGNDTIYGNQGDDALFGGAKWDGIERDHKPSYNDNDHIEGGTGNDQIWGNAGSDDLYGGEGHDVVFGGKGDDYLAGNDGSDALFGNSGGDGIEGGAGDDKIFGNSGDDGIDDGDGNDYVSGGSGDDQLYAGQGNDYHDGGSGFDTLNFYQAQNGVKVDLSKGTALGMGDDHFKSIEGAVGSGFADNLRGNKGDNLIAGNAGDDLIRGAEGSDTLHGGMGHDTFQYMKKDIVQGGANQGVDTIIDFTSADTLDMKDITKGHVVTNIEDFIQVTDNGQDSTVFAKIGGQFHEVAHLTDFAGHSATDMLASGMLLA